MKNILVLDEIKTPYRIYLFNKMNEFYQDKDIIFKVVFLSESDKNRHWKKFDICFDYEVLENLAIRVGRKDLFTFFINRKITSLLAKENPDKIICFGWANLATYISNYWARKNKKEFILRAGSTKYEKSWRRSLFNPIVKLLVKNSDKCVGYGTRAKEYLIQLGADPKNVEILINQINVEYFEEKAKNYSEEQKNMLKNMLGIKTSKTVFFNGQLIERKGIFELLDGFKLYQEIDSNISLLILGKGREKEKMKKKIENNNIKNVFFADFVQYEEVYKYYTISDLLILPSQEEVWGLVINEAMACGLPVITTNVTGASEDLIDDGENGYIIDVNCPECIANSIKKIFEKGLNKKNTSNLKINEVKLSKTLLKLKSFTFET